MEQVYVLTEERETSVSCRICGVWRSREDACEEMQRNIKENPLFTEESRIDLDLGIAESTPDYCEEEYCNYSVLEYEIL